jgi:hypothetical protein
MPHELRCPIMTAMTHPLTSSKILLVVDPRTASAEQGSPAVRRYRIARLRFDGRSQDTASRFEHLKRSYD